MTTFILTLSLGLLFGYFIEKSIGEKVLNLLRRAPRAMPLYRSPGWRLRRLAELVFSPKTCTTVLEPPLADLQKEYFQALAENRPWKARFVLIRGYWSFWSAVAAQLPISIIKQMYKLWKASQ